MNQLNVDKIQKIPDENQQKIIQSILSNHQANISHFLTKKKKKEHNYILRCFNFVQYRQRNWSVLSVIDALEFRSSDISQYQRIQMTASLHRPIEFLLHLYDSWHTFGR